MEINSTIGKYLQGQDWNTDTRAQKALAGDIEAMEAAEEAAELAKSNIIFGFMTKGKESI